MAKLEAHLGSFTVSSVLEVSLGTFLVKDDTPPPPPPPPPPSPEGRFSAEAYANQLRALLPHGLAWAAEPGSFLAKVLLAIGDELARVDRRAAILMAESDPRTAVEMLEDWERVFGLPDGCRPEIPLSYEERQVAVAQRLASRGGQSRAFFIAVAAALGFEGATIDEYLGGGLRVGFRVGDRAYGDGWAYVWSLNLPASATPSQRDYIECVVRRAAPAHTQVYFSYI